MSPQPNKNCEEILAKEIVIDNTNRNQISISLEDAARELIGCGIDSLDYRLIFKDTISLSLGIDEVTERNQERTIISYAQLLKGIKKIIKKEAYQKIKQSRQSFYQLFKSPADINNWSRDKKILKEIGKEETEINAIYEVLKTYSNPSITYYSFFRKYRLEIGRIKQLERDVQHHPKVSPSTIELYRLSRKDYYHEVFANSKKENKPVLFYFNRLDSDKARSMEQVILKDPKIWQKVEDKFILFPLFLDDNAVVFHHELIHPLFRGKKIASMKGRNVAIQHQMFNTNKCPFFAIVNSKEEVLETMGDTLEKVVFEKFLDKGLGDEY